MSHDSSGRAILFEIENYQQLVIWIWVVQSACRHDVDKILGIELRRQPQLFSHKSKIWEELLHENVITGFHGCQGKLQVATATPREYIFTGRHRQCCYKPCLKMFSFTVWIHHLKLFALRHTLFIIYPAMSRCRLCIAYFQKVKTPCRYRISASHP